MPWQWRLLEESAAAAAAVLGQTDITLLSPNAISCGIMTPESEERTEPNSCRQKCSFYFDIRQTGGHFKVPAKTHTL